MPGLADHGERVVLLEEELAGGVEAEATPAARAVEQLRASARRCGPSPRPSRPRRSSPPLAHERASSAGRALLVGLPAVEVLRAEPAAVDAVTRAAADADDPPVLDRDSRSRRRWSAARDAVCTQRSTSLARDARPPAARRRARATPRRRAYGVRSPHGSCDAVGHPRRYPGFRGAPPRPRRRREVRLPRPGEGEAVGAERGGRAVPDRARGHRAVPVDPDGDRVRRRAPAGQGRCRRRGSPPVGRAPAPAPRAAGTRRAPTAGCRAGRGRPSRRARRRRRPAGPASARRPRTRARRRPPRRAPRTWSCAPTDSPPQVSTRSGSAASAPASAASIDPGSSGAAAVSGHLGAALAGHGGEHRAVGVADPAVAQRPAARGQLVARDDDRHPPAPQARHALDPGRGQRADVGGAQADGRLDERVARRHLLAAQADVATRRDGLEHPHGPVAGRLGDLAPRHRVRAGRAGGAPVEMRIAAPGPAARRTGARRATRRRPAAPRAPPRCRRRAPRSRPSPSCRSRAAARRRARERRGGGRAPPRPRRARPAGARRGRR